MFRRFMPREGKFFDLFNEHAALIVEGGHEVIATGAPKADIDVVCQAALRMAVRLRVGHARQDAS